MLRSLVFTAMLTLLALALAVVALGLVAVLATRIGSLSRRIEAIQRQNPALPSRETVRADGPLQGLRIALSIGQDHPHPVFATLLKEALLREGALVEPEPLSPLGEGLAVNGTVVCNGYADVYFRAEILVVAGGETLLTVAEKPSHGDRQENLAREVVARLRTEWPKRERHGALRELGSP